MIVKSDGEIEMVKFTSVTKEFKNETHIYSIGLAVGVIVYSYGGGQ